MFKMSETEAYKPINIPDLAYRVSPALGKIIPGFLYRYFEKLLHVDEINTFIRKHYEECAQDFLDAAVEFFNLKIALEGDALLKLESLAGKQVMIVSNHPCGGPEAIAFLDIVHSIFPDIKLLAQGFLKFIKPMQQCCVYNKKEVRSLSNALDAGNSLLIYPAGYCSRKLSFGEVFDFEWKQSFVKIAKKYKMPIVVFHTDGTLGKRMSRWYNFRKFFKIKTSVETVFLVDEMFRMRGKTLTMTAGEIIDTAKLTDDVSNEEWAARLRQYCHELGNNSKACFDYYLPATLPLK